MKLFITFALIVSGLTYAAAGAIDNVLEGANTPTAYETQIEAATR